MITIFAVVRCVCAAPGMSPSASEDPCEPELAIECMQTLEGTLAFVTSAAVGSGGLCLYMHAMVPGSAVQWLSQEVLTFIAAASFSGAIVETLPGVSGVNVDNVLIPASTVAVAAALGMLPGV